MGGKWRCGTISGGSRSDPGESLGTSACGRNTGVRCELRSKESWAQGLTRAQDRSEDPGVDPGRLDPKGMNSVLAPAQCSLSLT